MQIAVGALARAMKTLVRLVPKKSTMRVLQHVRVEPVQCGIAITATDLITEAQVVLPTDAPFPMVVPAHDLLGFAQTLDRDAMIAFEQRDKLVRIAAAGSSVELPCLPATDFPKPIAHTSATDTVAVADSNGFIDALEWALLAVGHDPTRPQLTGVLLERDRVVAVDGHRLHVATVPMRACPRALILADCAAFATRALRGQGFQISVGQQTVRLAGATCTITTKKVEETFPPYDQVIPVTDRAEFHMDVDAVAFGKTLRRVARPGRTRSERPIRIRANGAISIESTVADTKLAASVSVIDSTHAGADHVQGFNARYLADAIADGDGSARLSFYRTEDPVRIDMGGRIAVVMPFRI